MSAKRVLLAGTVAAFLVVLLWMRMGRGGGVGTVEAAPVQAQIEEPAAPPPTDGSAPTVPVPSPAAELPLYSLLDHNDAAFVRPGGMTGLVVIFVGSKWREQTTLWSDYLGEHLPKDCVQANVLDLRHMTRMAKKVVSMGINAEADDEKTQIWLDWDGTMADHLGVSLEELNIVCMDERGGVIKRVKDNFTEAKGAEVVALYSGPGAGAAAGTP